MKAELDQRFAAEPQAYQTLKDAAEAAVVKWRYSKGMLWSFHANQADILTTEELPNEKGAEHAYGYDQKGRIVCVRGYTLDRENKFVGGESKVTVTQRVSSEEFIRHTGDVMEISQFYTSRPPELERRLANVYWVRTQGGRTVEMAELGLNGFDHVEYFWEGDLLKSDRNFDEKGKVVMEAEYVPDGPAKIYKIRKDGSRWLLGQPMPKGVTVKSLIEVVRRRLLEVIPQTVKAAGIREPVYCVALAYDGEGNDVLGPYLGIGLDSERQKWLAERGKDAWQMVWNPAEFEHYEKPNTQLEDEELENASEWLNGALSERSPAPAIKLLVEVAAELEKLDWSGIINTTPDFAVYAVDFELGDLKKNLKKIVSPEKLKDLKTAKLI